jgi:hypothetical protein
MPPRRPRLLPRGVPCCTDAAGQAVVSSRSRRAAPGAAGVWLRGGVWRGGVRVGVRGQVCARQQIQPSLSGPHHNSLCTQQCACNHLYTCGINRQHACPAALCSPVHAQLGPAADSAPVLQRVRGGRRGGQNTHGRKVAAHPRGRTLCRRTRWTAGCSWRRGRLRPCPPCHHARTCAHAKSPGVSRASCMRSHPFPGLALPLLAWALCT